MHYLFIFPHPDDESFGPASSISYLKRHGNKVSLLTLTKGGATKVRHKLNLSIEEMGEIRYKEMLCVEKVLNLDNLTVLDLPDSGLKEIDPRIIEQSVENYIRKVSPDIIITYPVHGISGFHDHLITHSVVKRVYVELKSELHLKRLAFFTLSKNQAQSNDGIHRLNYSNDEEIDCILNVEEQDVSKMNEALDCYITYAEVIENSIRKSPPFYKAHFELFDEEYQTPLSNLNLDL
ncbi:MAG: PIG-L family deacetylase [Chitinophagales bacterium]|nr:PIG-L family deacetylase [Chitinophagales bacterium]